MYDALMRVLEKRANVATAGGTFTAPGSANMPGKGYGAANIPGMSVHCLNCGAKLTKSIKDCPKCGHDVDNVLDLEKGMTTGDAGETGGEAALNETKDTEKYASVADFLAALPGAYGKLSPTAKAVGGVASLSSGTYGAIKLRKLTRGQQPSEKTAAARLGNPVLNIRKPAMSNMAKAVLRMLKAGKKSRG